MVVPKSLKLNRFRICQIPSAKEIIERFGMTVGSNYSGDEVAPGAQTKLDMILEMDALNGNKLAKEMAELRDSVES